MSGVLLWFIVENVVPSVVTLLCLLFIQLSFLFYLFFYLCATDCIFLVNKDYRKMRAHLVPFLAVYNVRHAAR